MLWSISSLKFGSVVGAVEDAKRMYAGGRFKFGTNAPLALIHVISRGLGRPKFLQVYNKFRPTRDDLKIAPVFNYDYKERG